MKNEKRFKGGNKMTEEFETEKWKIFFKENPDKIDESYIELIFRLRKGLNQIGSIPEKDLQELKKDLQDLGKWRKFKELKKDLED